jgi:enoyl-CoA hydratase/carnithine racemase
MKYLFIAISICYLMAIPGLSQAHRKISRDQLRDKISGYWIGQCAGNWTGKSAVTMRLALCSISLGSNTDIANAMEIEASGIEAPYDSHDLGEGVHAYLEKRKPDFWDR